MAYVKFFDHLDLKGVRPFSLAFPFFLLFSCLSSFVLPRRMPVLMTRCMLCVRARGAGSLLRTSAQCMGCTVCEHLCLDWAWMRKDEDVLDDEPHKELASVEGLKAPAVCYVQREVGACCARNFYLLSTGGGRARRTDDARWVLVGARGVRDGDIGAIRLVRASLSCSLRNLRLSSIHDSVSSKMSLTPPTSLPLPLTLLPASLLPSVARLLHPCVLAALLSHAPTHRCTRTLLSSHLLPSSFPLLSCSDFLPPSAIRIPPLLRILIVLSSAKAHFTRHLLIL
ncbi:hypothetical protein B0H13DRAFT_2328384 [Mycena leptocephala]|nr:hypothetical protein B0H13DRAFT_2328384 [Mycena leptocephala]